MPNTVIGRFLVFLLLLIVVMQVLITIFVK